MKTCSRCGASLGSDGKTCEHCLIYFEEDTGSAIAGSRPAPRFAIASLVCLALAILISTIRASAEEYSYRDSILVLPSLAMLAATVVCAFVSLVRIERKFWMPFLCAALLGIAVLLAGHVH